MAVDKLVDSAQLDSDLGNIAIAIRTKGGTSAQLTFPSGFISAIEAITTGITPTGTINITQSGNTDVTNYATANVASGSATTPATTITANPSISVNSSGLITASVSASQSVTPTVSSGYVTSGTSGTITVSGSNTSQLTTQSAQTITPTTTNQTIASGKYLTGVQTILGDANLLAENIKKDVVIFGITGTYEGGGSANYNVTVSLTNPRNASEFGSCSIFEALSGSVYDSGSYLDSIASSHGSKTVQVSSSVYGILVEVTGMSVSIPTSGISTTGGVTFITKEGGQAVFEVTGDGTATLDSIDYDD